MAETGRIKHGANRVFLAEAVLLSADSSAPKKAICSTTGMWPITRVGRIFCGSSAISSAERRVVAKPKARTRRVSPAEGEPV